MPRADLWSVVHLTQIRGQDIPSGPGLPVVSVVLAGAKIRGGGCRVKAGEGTAQQCRVVKPGRRVSTGVSHLFITSWLAVQSRCAA
jgi:hypothetical protein